MKKIIFLVMFVAAIFFTGMNAGAQCSICTRTAAQMGEKPAKGLNAGILYLAFTPLAIAGVIGYKFWRKNRGQS
jgi:archaellum component FlaG (FlaF/FlaG flagellin family)